MAFSFFKNKDKNTATKAKAEEKKQVPSKVVKPKFAALGGCVRSEENYQNIKTAVELLGFKDSVERIKDTKDIASYGVLQVPAFAIEGRVVSYGRAITVETAKSYIIKSGLNPKGNY